MKMSIFLLNWKCNAFCYATAPANVRIGIVLEVSRQSDSNRRPADYKSAALPAELCRRLRGKTSPSRSFATLIVPPNCTPFEFNRLAAACELVGSGLTAPFSLRLFRKQVDSFNADVRWECCIRSRATSFSPLYWRSSAFAG